MLFWYASCRKFARREEEEEEEQRPREYSEKILYGVKYEQRNAVVFLIVALHCVYRNGEAQQVVFIGIQ
jgi:hypothetical protein